ncbi:MAG: CoA transferase [bacterium]|nr:CoA transferase [bacterium]
MTQEHQGILSGLRVIELGDTLSSALVGQLMADYGAEVIQVEPPGGSLLRKQAVWPVLARGKKSIELDLASKGNATDTLSSIASESNASDRAVAQNLLSTADVAVASFRPNVANRLGIGPQAMTNKNPRLVYASIHGFPSTGPLANAPGYEGLVMAKVGGWHAMAPTVDRDGPAFFSTPYAAFAASQTALHGILAALHERESSGAGQHVETTLMAAMASIDPWNWMLPTLIAKYPEAFSAAGLVDENRVPNTPMTFMLLVGLTKDGKWLQFSQVQPHLFRALIKMLQLDWMYDDPKWKTLPVLDTAELRLEFWEIVLEKVRSHTLAEWQEMFEQDHDVWAEIFRSGAELLDHPQLVYDGRIIEIEDPQVGLVRQIGPMVKYLRGPDAKPERAAPTLNAHEAELRELYSKAQPGVRGNALASVSQLPLAGITVLELGTFYAGPFGATVLTDLGARVIKVEQLDGDPMRSILPFPEIGAARVLQGKESVAVDITTEQGREVVHALAARTDLVLQTFRAGAAERLGIDADTLLSINPNLAYVNAPGYGIDGPCGDRPAYAPTIGAGSGMARRNAAGTVQERANLTMEEIRANSLRLTENNTAAFGQADGVSALGVATALLLGLVARDRGYGGTSALTSMLTTCGTALCEQMLDYDGTSQPPSTAAELTASRDTEKFGLGPLYRLYPAKQGWVFVAAPTQRAYQRLRQALAASGNTAETLPEDAAAVRAEALGAIFVTQDAAAWEADLLEAGVVQVTEQAPEYAFLGPLGHQNGVLAEVNHPTFDDYFRLAPMVRFSRSETVAKPGCLLGQHTNAVLAELGYSAKQMASLKDQGIIGG